MITLLGLAIASAQVTLIASGRRTLTHYAVARWLVGSWAALLIGHFVLEEMRERVAQDFVRRMRLGP